METMTTATYEGEFGTLVIETEQVEVTTNLPQPDKAWRFTDAAGHEHYMVGEGYPTLVSVLSDDGDGYWCAECGADHVDTHLECPICHEAIVPGTVDPSGFREFTAGPTSYWLNDEEISKEYARELVEAFRQPRRGRLEGEGP